MKVSDLVTTKYGHTGIVTGIGYSAEFKTYLESPSLNPDIHVMTKDGQCVWSYKDLKVINEAG